MRKSALFEYRGKNKNKLTNSLKLPSPIVVISHISDDELIGPLRLDGLSLPGSRWTAVVA